MNIQQFESDKNLTPTLFNNFGTTLVMVFYADWNEKSKSFLTIFKNSLSIFGENQNVKYFSICAQKCPQTFKKYNVEYTPAVIVTRTDKKILKKFQVQQTDVGEIFSGIEEICSEQRQQFLKEQKVWHRKIKSILESCPIIVFIKGTPENPKCGFTQTLLAILKQQKVQYTYYDIIQDQYMRYWLRQYRKWPTYPQLFINGQIIGGLDKIKQYVANGQFSKMVPQSSRKCKGEDKYKSLIKQQEIIAFIDGFSFENQSCQQFLKKSAQTYGQEKLYVYNVASDLQLKEFLEKTIHKLPFIVKNGQLIQ